MVDALANEILTKKKENKKIKNFGQILLKV
jgi:hypothetical protein